MSPSVKLFRYQAGLTAGGLVLVLMFVGFFATAAVKIGPAYVENRTIAQALQTLKGQYAGKDLREISDKAIMGSMGKILSVNMVSDEAADSIAVRRVKGDVFVSANYEIRNNFMSNVDVVVVFENEVNLAE